MLRMYIVYHHMKKRKIEDIYSFEGCKKCAFMIYATLPIPFSLSCYFSHRSLILQSGYNCICFNDCVFN